MAVMISELRSYTKTPGWSEQARLEYFLWAKEVVQHFYSANFGMASSLQCIFQAMNI
jgi:hypothetical protein